LIASQAQHENIVRFIDFQVESKLLFMEYCPKGSLYDILHVQNSSGRRRNKSPKTADPSSEFIKHHKNIIKGVINGMKHYYQYYYTHTYLL
jgi:serine/threonine protein kinase